MNVHYVLEVLTHLMRNLGYGICIAYPAQLTPVFYLSRSPTILHITKLKKVITSILVLNTLLTCAFKLTTCPSL